MAESISRSTPSTSSCSISDCPTRKDWTRCGGPMPPRPRVPLVVLTGLDDESLAAQALQEGAQDYLIKGQIETRGLLRALRYADRAQDHGGGVVRGEGTRPGHAQLHRRRRRLHRHRRATSPSSISSRRRMTGWSLAGGHRAGRWPKCSRSSTPRVAKPSPTRWRRPWSKTGPSHLPSNCILVRRDGFEIPIEDSVAPIHDREGQATGAVIVFRDVSAARAMALQIDPFGPARLSDRPAQPHAPQRPDQPGDRAGATSREPGRGAVPGSGRLQAHQRFARTSDRRQAAAVRRRAPGGLRPRLGHGEPAGRRRIRGAAVGGGAVGGRRRSPREECCRRSRSAHSSTSTTFTSPRASA